MVLIVFFEKDSIENICSCLTNTVDTVYLIGSNIKVMEPFANIYKKVLAGRGINVEFICKTSNRNNMTNILQVLSEIIEENEECMIDLTGGDDLFLTAAGIVFERYKERNLKLQRYNILTNSIIDADMDGVTMMTDEAPLLTVDENVKIYGGDIIYDKDRDNTTFHWDLNDEFKKDAKALWRICCKNTKLWNSQTTLLATVEKLAGNDDLLTVSVPMENVQSYLKVKGWRLHFSNSFFEELNNRGYITSFTIDEETFSVTYKNHQIKYCLMMAGQILEMKVFLSALEATDKDGTPTYNDAMNGVFIDWDGDIHPNHESYDTENEIDVILMHGLIPVFISCKNGIIEMEELYKLNTVAERFGGKYVKKVLVASSLDDSEPAQYIRQRARDIGIRIVEGHSKAGVHKRLTWLTDEEWNIIIRSLWLN